MKLDDLKVLFDYNEDGSVLDVKDYLEDSYPGFEKREANGVVGFHSHSKGLLVMPSPTELSPDRSALWIHVYRKSKKPTLEDMNLVRNLFVGDRKALIALVPKKDDNENQLSMYVDL
jgi:hypothetical protein